MKKLILKPNFSTNFSRDVISGEQLNRLRDKVISDLKTDGVAVVPEWCEVYIIDDFMEEHNETN